MPAQPSPAPAPGGCRGQSPGLWKDSPQALGGSSLRPREDCPRGSGRTIPGGCGKTGKSPGFRRTVPGAPGGPSPRALGGQDSPQGSGKTGPSPGLREDRKSPGLWENRIVPGLWDLRAGGARAQRRDSLPLRVPASAREATGGSRPSPPRPSPLQSTPTAAVLPGSTPARPPALSSARSALLVDERLLQG